MTSAPPKRRGIAGLLSGIKTLGLALAVKSAVYPVRRHYHEAKFSGVGASAGHGSVFRGLLGLVSTPKAPGEQGVAPQNCTLLGDLLGYSSEGQTVVLRCENGSVQVTILAADLLRVRLSHSGDFPSPRSYALAKADDDWAPAPYTLSETAEALEMHTARLTCRVTRRPCRLEFLDARGHHVHADAAGCGWLRREHHQGRPVIRFSTLEPDEHVYGLGEKAFPCDRRGRSYTLWNTDPHNYPPGADPLYLNIPFYLGLHDGQSYGIFYDNTYRSRLDLGATRADEAGYLAEDGELRYYFFYGPSLATVLERYTELTGRMPLPPLWALGYQQSRWSYYPESRVREITGLFRKHRIPCDVLHLDIHYMDGYRCFTWDRQRFPDSRMLLADLHREGFRVVTLIDCGVKVDRNYHVCAEGLAGGMFCTYPDGTPAGGPVWPGECYFPDFTSARVREWWGRLHAPLLEAGVDGIWNDMNEPVVIAPQPDTLAGCVHHDWEGQGADHRQAHNVYGMQMARATREGLQRLRPDERPFVFTRSGWAGVQRYATSWTADNQSTWEHLRLTMPMLMGLGLSGLAFVGPDVGGFEGGASAELLVRWTQMGVFLPFFRNHTALLNPGQEPWAFGEPYLSLNRSAIELRYRLLPYLYTAVWQCTQSGLPIVRPLCLAYPEDRQTHALDDEFLCGDALLVAPVCQAGATSRDVYLPAGAWFDYWTDQRHTGPEMIRCAAPLERIPFFVRAGAVVPHWPVMQHTGEAPVEVLTLHVYGGDGESELYEDDGHSLAYQQGENRVVKFTCQHTAEGGLSIACHALGPYLPTYRRWEWIIHGLDRAPQQALADGQPVQSVAWDSDHSTLRFETDEVQLVQLVYTTPQKPGF